MLAAAVIRLLATFPRALLHKPLHVLDIPDDYQFMDPELVQELERAVAAVLAPSAEDCHPRGFETET